MKIGIASDHAGYDYKEWLITQLTELGHELVNFGCDSNEACDYPDYGHPLASAVENGEVEKGISVCGSGNGINMVVNKHQGVRSALCWNVEISKLARAHNDANVCAIPARFTDKDLVMEIVKAFLSTGFDGGRHQRRIDKI